MFLLLTVIVCIFLIGVNNGCDNSQDSLNKKKGKEIMDITIASSDVVSPSKVVRRKGI